MAGNCRLSAHIGFDMLDVIAEHRNRRPFILECYHLEPVKHDENAVSDRLRFIELGLDAFGLIKEHRGRLDVWQSEKLKDLVSQYAACSMIRFEQLANSARYAHGPVGTA